MICVFCLCEKEGQRSVEHIIPESLGGGDWAVLPPETVCDLCNQYFGAKVESEVLQDYPLNVLRLFSGVRTKKKKWAIIDHPIGKLSASPYDRVIGLEPSSEDIEYQLLTGNRTQFRIIAETKNPLLLCRFLLKVALECVARDCVLNAMKVRYAEARRFARSPQRGDSWWFMYRFDPSADGRQNKEVQAEIVEIEDAELGLISIYGCKFLVPLHRRIVYEASDLQEPEYRYFAVNQ
ncbi:MAG: hypothetical protein IH625_01980 [Rhodobacteraceae bacterium]|nr:hypothetical protein [Paracoccaceae bacterium]